MIYYRMCDQFAEFLFRSHFRNFSSFKDNFFFKMQLFLFAFFHEYDSDVDRIIHEINTNRPTHTRNYTYGRVINLNTINYGQDMLQ